MIICLISNYVKLKRTFKVNLHKTMFIVAKSKLESRVLKYKDFDIVCHITVGKDKIVFRTAIFFSVRFVKYCYEKSCFNRQKKSVSDI